MAKKATNEVLADDLRAHVFDLLKLSNSERKKVLAALNKLQRQLLEELLASGVDGEEGMTPFQKQRMQELFVNATGTISTAYRDINVNLNSELSELAEMEAEWLTRKVNKRTEVHLVDNFITREQARTIVSDVLVEGAPSSEWWERQAEQTKKDFSDTMRQGMLRGETLQQLTQRVTGGTKGGQPVAGIPDFVGKAKRNAEALVRSSVMTVANVTRRKLYEGNEDVVKGIQQVSTLDTRTSLICMAYAGAAWDLDYQPIPPNVLPFGQGCPRHWGCRSTETPVLKDASDILGIPGLPKLPKGTRASMDGQVPADMTFDEWMKGKEASDPGFADAMLGPARAQMWREGKLSLQDLVSDKGTAKSVAELKQDLGLDKASPEDETAMAAPAAGTATGKVWEIADQLAQGGGPVLRKEVIARAIEAGVNPATAATQFAKWRAEQKVTPPPAVPPVAPVPKPTPVTPPPTPPAVSTLETATFLDAPEYKAKLATLTPEQKEALKEYTLSDYAEVNEFLRGLPQSEHAVKRATKTLQAIDGIMAKDVFITEKPLILHRGLSGKDDYLVRTDPAKLVGSAYKDTAFGSTTTGKADPYFAERATLEIHAPAGVRGVYLDSLSGNAGEKEFLLNRGITYDILKVEVQADGHRKIVMQARLPEGEKPVVKPPTAVVPPAQVVPPAKVPTPPEVIRPKAGTASARIWDLADAAMKDGKTPSPKDIVELAKLEGINPATAATQFARWRKAQVTGDPAKTVTPKLVETKDDEAKKAAEEAELAKKKAAAAAKAAAEAAEKAAEAKRLAELAEAELKKSSTPEQLFEQLQKKVKEQKAGYTKLLEESAKAWEEGRAVRNLPPTADPAEQARRRQAENTAMSVYYETKDKAAALRRETELVVRRSFVLEEPSRAFKPTVAFVKDLPPLAQKRAMESINQAVETLVNFIPASNMPGPSARPNFLVKKKERAYYRDNGRTLCIDGLTSTSVVAHEMGHWLEHRSLSGLAADNAQRFLAYRTKGETAKPLNTILKTRSYRADEEAKPDKFPDAYMGKIYAFKSTEVTSTSLQYLIEKPMILSEDKEMYTFLMCQLRGLEWRPPSGN